MVIKQVNLVISLTSKVLNYVIIFSFAVLLAKFVWWFFGPSTSDVYIDKPNVAAFDTVAKFIINRSPFGVVLAPPIPPKPAIASQIKLTGVYVNTVANSIAFYELNNKDYIAKVGDKISGEVIVKSINSNGMVVSENNVDAEVNLSSGTTTSAQPSSPSNIYNSYRPTAPIQNNYNQDINNTANYNTNQNIQQSTQNTNEGVEARRKLIDEFMKRRGTPESSRGGRDANENSY